MGWAAMAEKRNDMDQIEQMRMTYQSMLDDQKTEIERAG